MITYWIRFLQNGLMDMLMIIREEGLIQPLEIVLIGLYLSK